MPESSGWRERRTSLRMPGRNYRQHGVYFVTIVVHGRIQLLGTVQHGSVVLSTIGQIVADTFAIVAERFPTAQWTQWVVMPNHVHAVIRLAVSNTVSLSKLVGTFKGLSAHRVNEHEKRRGPFWQRGYHERFVRSATMLAVVERYIAQNPRRWSSDVFHRPSTHTER